MGELLKTAEVAKLMGVSRNTVSMWREEGLLGGTWIGHGYAYPDWEVEKLQEVASKYRISNRYYAQLAMSMIAKETT